MTEHHSIQVSFRYVECSLCTRTLDVLKIDLAATMFRYIYKDLCCCLLLMILMFVTSTIYEEVPLTPGSRHDPGLSDTAFLRRSRFSAFFGLGPAFFG